MGGNSKTAAFTRVSGLSTLLILTLACPVRASFQLQPESVRSVSMGGASLGASGEAVALFTNPAGIAQVKRIETSFIYSKLFTGLPGVDLGLGSVSFALPTRIGSFGMGMGSFIASGLKEERTLALSFGRNFLEGRLQMGLTGKQFYHSYKIGSDRRAARDPVFSNGTSKSAFGLDLGASASVMGPLKLGVAVRNINEPDVGLASEDRIRREFQIGINLDLAGVGIRAFGDIFYKEMGFSTDQQPFIPAFGVEKALGGDSLSFRLGANPLEFTGGFGLKVGNMGFNYALVLNRNLMQDNVGTHRVGLSLRFGNPIAETRDLSSDNDNFIWR